MSLLADLLAELVGEAAFSFLRKPLHWYFRILNIWILIALWLATPFVELWIFKYLSSRDSIIVFYVSIVASIGWPSFAVISSIILLRKKQGTGVAA